MIHSSNHYRPFDYETRVSNTFRLTIKKTLLKQIQLRKPCTEIHPLEIEVFI